MQISMLIEVKLDRRKETIGEFAKNYLRFKHHILRLQALGHLPREGVKIKPSITQEQPLVIEAEVIGEDHMD